MSDKKRQSRGRRLVTIRVTPMTYRHLCAMAEVSGLKFPGQAVDKLVRSLALQARGMCFERSEYGRLETKSEG